MPSPEKPKSNWRKKDGVWKDSLARDLDTSVTGGLDINYLKGLQNENDAFLKKILSPTDYGRIMARKRARTKR